MRYWMLTAVLLAFWLGRETGAGEEAAKEILLTNGEWTTEIRPGSLLMRGPNNTSVVLEAGRVVEVTKTNEMTLSRPRLLLTGPMDEARSGYPAKAILMTSEDSAWVSVNSSVARTAGHDDRESGPDPRLAMRPGGVLGASPDTRATLTLRDKGKKVTDLPDKK